MAGEEQDKHLQSFHERAVENILSDKGTNKIHVNLYVKTEENEKLPHQIFVTFVPLYPPHRSSLAGWESRPTSAHQLSNCFATHPPSCDGFT